ncbi:MAG: winged helix-turn-helix transcriptional regulator [Vallitalea sp.]|nr:winged helix-turn-helix transcriptional regulator [Vallitalea sp.]
MSRNNIKKIIKNLSQKHGITMKSIAEELGMTKQNFNNQLTRGTIKYRDYIKALDFLGYEIILRKKK